MDYDGDDGDVQNTKQGAPEPGTHDLNEKTPLLEEEAPKIHAELRPSSTAITGRHLIPLAVLALLGAVWLAQIYYPGAVPRPYAVCTRRRSAIFTVDPARPTAQCILVNEYGRIADIGSAGEVRERNPHVRFASIPHDAIIVPGLVDSHAHLLMYGWAKSLDLSGSQSVDEVVRRVREYILARPDVKADTTAWIEGVGWDQSLWNDMFPTAADLDADPVLRDRPIILYRKDIHVAWVSSKALELTVPGLPDKVNGGEIIRDPSGKPTGILLDNAILLVHVPVWSESKMREYFTKASSDALSVGLTGIHDAATTDLEIAFYKKLADENPLPLRMYLMANRDEGYWGKDIEKLFDYGNGRLNLRSVKLFADGALGSWGAKMYKPYSDNPSSTGIWRVPLKTLKRDIPKYISDGWQVNVHCIGDEANGRVLGIFASVLKGKDATALRPRIEHAQIISPRDLKRFADLGVIASIQPTHATSDMWIAENRLGDRLKGAYALKTLLNLGARTTLGSDFPVESHNPLYTFYAAVTRLSVDGDSPSGPDGWHPEEKLTREEALKGLTLDPAYASFTERDLGSLMIGKRADFVVLDRNIMAVPAGEILQTKVLATVLDGVVQFGRLK